MKTEQEQIEEMAQCMCGSKKECIKFYKDEHPCVNNAMCKNIQAAEIFYKAGYRKASDVIDDFVERVKERLEEFTKQDYEDGVPYYHADCEQIDNVIDDVADEMRQEVEK